MLSSHAKFDANGFGMLIRDLENLYLYVGGSNDIRQDAQQSVSQDNSEPLASAPIQQTGFDGVGGMGNLGQPALQNVPGKGAQVSYPIVPAKGGTGVTTIPAHAVVLGEGAAPVATAAPGTAGLSLVSNGASADPTFQAVPVAGITGVLPIAKGGTASGTALSGSKVMVSNGTAIVQGPAGTTTTVLHGNAAGAPAYSAVDLAADVTGILGVANGGTAGNTQATARTGLGLGTIATQNANNVTITGGNITGGYIGPLFYNNAVSFTSSGTWTVPSGVFSALVVCTGAGGGGGGSTTSTATGLNLGGGGGAGGTTGYGVVSVAPSAVITITIGAAGTAGASGGGTGGAGGASSFASIVVMSGAGGGGGGGSSASGLGGRPSSGFGFLSFTGQINIPGVQGENAFITSASVSGGNVVSLTQTGGRGGTSVNSTGGSSGGGGAGAAGGTNAAGTAGQAGMIVIYY